MSEGKRGREAEEELSGSKKVHVEEEETDALVVCGIDLGRTCMRYAFACTRRAAQTESLQGLAGHARVVTGKTHPTSLLPDHSVNFTQSLKLLKDEVLSEISIDPKSAGMERSVTESEIKWSVTVPAGTRGATSVMRKAAFDTGMLSDKSSDKLVLYLEPIAAILACEANRFAGREGGAAAAGSHEILTSGDTCMVLDCGGCNVRTTVHCVEATSPLLLAQVSDPSGGPSGSTHVDQEGFEEFLKQLVGANIWSRVKTSWTGANVMQSWEQAKLQFNPAELRDEVGCQCSSPWLGWLIAENLGLSRTCSGLKERLSRTASTSITVMKEVSCECANAATLS